MTSDHACFGVPQPYFVQNQTGSNQNEHRERFEGNLTSVEHERNQASDMTIVHPGFCQDVETDPSAIRGIGPIPNHRLRSTPLTPQTWQEAEKLAKILCKSKIVPPGIAAYGAG